MAKRMFPIFAGVFICFFLIAGGTLIKASLDMKKRIAALEALKNKKLEQELVKEKQKLKNNLDEKYRADMISFQAMRKRVELQNQRIKKLESKDKKE